MFDEDGNEIEPEVAEDGEEGGEEDDGEECEEEEEVNEEEQEGEENEDDEEEANEWAVAIEPEAPVVAEVIPVAPAEVSVEAPVEAPVEIPVEIPVEAPIETPAEIPAEVSAEAQAEVETAEGQEEDEEKAKAPPVEKKVDFSDIVQQKIIDTDAPPKDPTPEPEPEPEPIVEPVIEEPIVEEPVVEDFVVTKRKPKFHISEYQLKKKFYFVNKLYNLGVPSGRTFRLQSVISSIDPITVEWRRNGRLLSNTPRTSIVTDAKTNVSIVEVTRTRLQDNGRYSCTATSDFSGTITDECDVSIYLPQPQDTGDQPPTFTRLLTGINFYRLQKY